LKKLSVFALFILLSISVFSKLSYASNQDRILGKSERGASWYGFNGRKFATRFEAFHNGKIVEAHAYVGYNGHTNFKVQMALYDDAVGAAEGNLLATSSQETFPFNTSVRYGWMTFTINYEVQKGHFYWLALMPGKIKWEGIWIEANIIMAYDTIQDNYSAHNLDDFDDGFSNPFNIEHSPSYQKKEYSMYAEIIGGGAGEPPPPWYHLRWEWIKELLKVKVQAPMWLLWTQAQITINGVLATVGALILGYVIYKIVYRTFFKRKWRIKKVIVER